MQSDSSNKQIKCIQINKSLKIQYRKLPIELYQNFQTAHSNTTTRTNFVVRISDKQNRSNDGYGQCGLPSKKPGIYMSDIDDCFRFMQDISDTINNQKFANQNMIDIQQEYFKFLNEIVSISQNKSILVNFIEILKNQSDGHILRVLNLLKDVSQFDYRAPKSAIQYAILDYLSKKYKLDLFNMLYGGLKQNQLQQTYSFYTVSLSQMDQMIDNTAKHLCYTKLIKYKYNQDQKSLIYLLKQLKKTNIPTNMKIIIDANCSWSPQIFRQFQLQLNKQQNKQILKMILFIEQPFDFNISQYEKWVQIKNTTKLKILADQSFRDWKDIQKIKFVSHAINIKCEKTGGFFNALKSSLMALQIGDGSLQLMYGSMVSTQLGCTQTYMLAPLCTYMDIDGSLLVKTPKISGGFTWNMLDDKQSQMQQFGEGKLVRNNRSHGLGVETQILQKLF